MVRYVIPMRMLAALAFSGMGSLLSAADEPLVRFEDLRYLGAFKLPDTWSTTRDDRLTLRYARGGVAFNPRSTTDPASPSLFISCFSASPNIAEVSIPNPVVPASGNLAELPTASIVQHCADAQRGASSRLQFGQGGISGILVSQSRLYFSYYDSYPAGGCPSASHFAKNSLDLSAGDAAGAYPLANSAGASCFVNGPMTWIPQEWRGRLGNKPAIAYQCCHSIITATSWGPAAFAFDPADLGAAPAPSVALQWYDEDHPALGEWNGKSTPLDFEPPWDNSWNNAQVPGYRGLVIPSGTASALYFTAQGIGPYCYGKGTADSSLHGKPTDDGTHYCYDLTDPGGSSKGDHAYPYRFHIMAFDLNDWAKAAAGGANPHEARPYAVWPLVSPTIPFADGRGNDQSGGAAYDPATRRIYWVQSGANGPLPIVQVWEVASASSIRPAGEARGQDLPDISLEPAGRLAFSWAPSPSARSVRIRLYDGEGRLRRQDVASLPGGGTGSRMRWDLSGLARGVYFVEARSGSAMGRKRISVIR